MTAINRVGQQVFVGVMVFAIGSALVAWFKRRGFIAPPVGKNGDCVQSQGGTGLGWTQ